MDGNFLKDFLAGKGVSVKNLAETLGCSTQNIYALFSQKSIKLSKLDEIARAAGIELQELLEGIGKNATAVDDLEARIKEKDAEIKRLNERIDRLLAIIERL